MPVRRIAAIAFLLCLTAPVFTSCVLKKARVITRLGVKANKELLTVNKAALVGEVAKLYASVQDCNATVDMTPALGSSENNKITEYKDFRAYVLFRKPSDIRIIGLAPAVRIKAFDMTSNGQAFRLYIPSKNRFLTGSNEIGKPSANKLENLRPQHFLDAMLVKPIDVSVDKVLMENYTDEENAFYILHEVHENGGGQLTLHRTIWFSRLDLNISRQLIFDAEGNILSDARYSEWKAFDNVAFPKHIAINRPRDDYGVVIDVVKLDMNKGLTDDKFVLEQPEGSTLQVVGEAPAPPSPAPAPGKKN